MSEERDRYNDKYSISSGGSSLLVYSPEVLKVILDGDDDTAAKLLRSQLLALPNIGPRRLEAIFGSGEPKGSHLVGFALMVISMMGSPDEWCREQRKMALKGMLTHYPSGKSSFLRPTQWTRESATTLLSWVRSYEDESRALLVARNLL